MSAFLAFHLLVELQGEKARKKKRINLRFNFKKGKNVEGIGPCGKILVSGKTR